jgi:hypothetical protein
MVWHKLTAFLLILRSSRAWYSKAKYDKIIAKRAKRTINYAYKCSVEQYDGVGDWNISLAKMISIGYKCDDMEDVEPGGWYTMSKRNQMYENCVRLKEVSWITGSRCMGSLEDVPMKVGPVNFGHK